MQARVLLFYTVVFIKSTIARPVQYNANTVPLSHGGSVDLGLIFGLLTYIGKEKMQ